MKLTDEQYWIKFAKLPNSEQKLIIQEALGTTQDVASNYYDLILNMIKRKQFLFELLNRKQDSSVIDVVRRLDEAKLQQVKARRERKETRLQTKFKFHIFEVNQLRQSNVGWHNIANYLKKEHKIKISYITVRRLYEKYKYLVEVDQKK